MYKTFFATLYIVFSVSNAFGQTVSQIAKNGISSTFSVITVDKNSQPLGYGSGFLIANELVATNFHVVEGANSVYILKSGETKRYLVDGYVALDKKNDLIILKCTSLNGNKLSLVDSPFPEIGERIYAIGNPKGLSGTFSEGIISGIREIDTSQVLQITAPISPGSSGGPVLNLNGDVVGVAFASFSSGQNLNFAIPIKYLIRLNDNEGIVQAFSTIKSSVKTGDKQTIIPSIKEGVVLRNVTPCQGCSHAMVSFSIKNNLPYSIAKVRILFLLYDNKGVVIDYDEATFPDSYFPIKPFLAKTYENYIDKIRVTWKSGYRFELRILDFKIIED